MRLRIATVAVPALMLVYGIARYFDGRDGEYGPGAAWIIGHVAFLGAFVGFGVLTTHFMQNTPSAGRSPRLAALASLVGISLFLWVILTDLVPPLDDRASLPDPVMAVGPPVFIVGFVTSVSLYARRSGMKLWALPPLLTLASLVVVAADLDLLPLTAVLLAGALIPLALDADQPARASQSSR